VLVADIGLWRSLSFGEVEKAYREVGSSQNLF